MDKRFSEHFINQWRKYFNNAELPIGFFYTNQPRQEDVSATLNETSCLIGNLKRVRMGVPLVYDSHTPGCAGGKRYTGFTQSLRPNFEYFLSCGIPGELEGERYKCTPELVERYLTNHPSFFALGSYLVFKRWDMLEENEEPLVVIFFAHGDILAGLFTLANYDMPDPDGVVTPMGSGCASIINYPLEEARSMRSRCVLGMFDVSARPHVEQNELTFAIPIERFKQLVSYMDESFLITGSWEKVRRRIGSGGRFANGSAPFRLFRWAAKSSK
jgi:hypothetical protein